MRAILLTSIIPTLILLTSLKAFPIEAKSPKLASCELLGLFPEKLGQLEHTRGARYFKVEDLDYGFSILGTLNSKSELSFQIDMVNHEAQIRSELRGKDLFRQMVDHLGIENILVINGLWLEGEDSTNWVGYEKNLRDGMSHEEAALNTWTGKRAVENGFSKVITIGKISIAGTPGIFVQFVRP